MNPKQFKHLTIGTLSAALAMPLIAQAELFTFDPTGTGAGPITQVALIDQAPGSALAEGGVTAINNFLAGAGSTNFTLHYQANLSAMQFADTSIAFSNGSGGNFFTFVAGFGETVVGASPYPGTASFQFDASNPVNFFNMYASNSIGNNLTGAGFTNGTPILTAHIVAIPTSNFQVTNTSGTALDQSPNGDQWGGQQTVTGGGLSDITLVVDSVNSGYFPSLNPSSTITISFFNSSQVDPFRQVDPSQCFNTDGSDCGAGGGITALGTLGAVNGTSGPNFIFQADGNQAFTVPEPASLALIGLGLSFMGFFGKSRRRAG
jgi:hypothetical protein